MDPALKKKIYELAAENRMNERVKIIGEHAYMEQAELRHKMSELRCSVGTVTAHFFSAECSAEAILELAEYYFIVYLELSRELYPLNYHNMEGGGENAH